MLAKTFKGFALVATRMQTRRRTRTFLQMLQAAMRSGAQPRVRTFARILRRVGTFGHTCAENLKGFALLVTSRGGSTLLNIAGQGSERVRTFSALATSRQKLENQAVTFHHNYNLKFVVKLQLFGRSWGGGDSLVRILAKGFQLLK